MADNRPLDSEDLEETNSESDNSELEEDQTVIENEDPFVRIFVKINREVTRFAFEKRSPGSYDKSEAIKQNCACTCRQAFREFLQSNPTSESVQLIRLALDNHNCCSRHKTDLDKI